MHIDYKDIQIRKNNLLKRHKNNKASGKDNLWKMIKKWSCNINEQNQRHH